MATSAVELDFFRMEETQTSAKPQPNKLFGRRRSFRDIQSVISKLNPELLKSVIASGSVDRSPKTFSVPSTPNPKHHENHFPSLPVYTSTSWSNACGSETAPLTIFYNGAVCVFNVPPHKAEDILKLAEGGVSKTVESAEDPELLETLDGGLPMARRKSLQRFLEKRKERLTLISPYGAAFSGKSI